MCDEGGGGDVNVFVSIEAECGVIGEDVVRWMNGWDSNVGCRVDLLVWCIEDVLLFMCGG